MNVHILLSASLWPHSLTGENIGLSSLRFGFDPRCGYQNFILPLYNGSAPSLQVGCRGSIPLGSTNSGTQMQKTAERWDIYLYCGPFEPEQWLKRFHDTLAMQHYCREMLRTGLNYKILDRDGNLANYF